MFHRRKIKEKIFVGKNHNESLVIHQIYLTFPSWNFCTIQYIYLATLLHFDTQILNLMESINGTLQKSFHQVHKRSRAVYDGLQTDHEPVLCIGINGYKRSFWVLCTALWASSQTIMSSFVSKFAKCYEQLREQVCEVLWATSWALKFTNYYEQLRFPG